MQYSDLFPVTKHSTYLMNAAQSPLNTRSEEALQSYLHLAATDLKARPSVREPIRQSLSALLGGKPEDYALTSSTGAGISIVAAGLNLSPGENVVLPAGEHWNNTFPWLRLQDQGIEVRFVEPDADNRVSSEAIAQRVDANTRVIATTAVRFDTGFRADLKAISKLANDCDALFVLDGIQCAGAHSTNVEQDGIDVLACGGFKWLLGMAGTGFLYVNERARDRISPVLPGMFAAKHDFKHLSYHDDARQYETGSLAYSLFHGWQAGLDLLQEVGVPKIQKRNLTLTDQIQSGLHALNFRILSPHDHPDERSAIISFTMGSSDANKQCAEKLEARGILVSHRGDSLRVSPNFYNTAEEVDRFLDMLA